MGPPCPAVRLLPPLILALAGKGGGSGGGGASDAWVPLGCGGGGGHPGDLGPIVLGRGGGLLGPQTLRTLNYRGGGAFLVTPPDTRDL